MSERILGQLFLVGLLDGLILACPLLLLGIIWPEKRPALFSVALVLIVLGILVTILGVTITSSNQRFEERQARAEKSRYRVNDEPE